VSVHGQSGRKAAGVALAAAFVIAGCGTDPTTTAEYVALADTLEAAEADLATSETDLADTAADAEQLRDELQATERALRDARADVDELRLRYDDEIRADLQADYDAELASACEQASQNPARPVGSFVDYDTAWDHLDVDEQQLVAAVDACAAPARERAQLTREDAAAALAPVADLVMAAMRSGDASDDLEDQIRGIVEAITTNAVYEDRNADWVETLDRLKTGYYCANSGCTVISLFDELMDLGGVPGLPAASMGGGSRPVGDGDDDAQPGTWVSYQVDGCYWERLDDRGETIDNNFVSSAPQVQVTIATTDFAFNSDGCGRWLRN
jgi:hypothetical protein